MLDNKYDRSCFSILRKILPQKYLLTRKNRLHFRSHLLLDTDLIIFCSILQHNNLANISGKTDQIFIKILSYRHIFGQKVPIIVTIF